MYVNSIERYRERERERSPAAPWSPCGRPWALVGRAFVGPLGPCGPPWALVGRALMGLIYIRGEGFAPNQPSPPPLFTSLT